MEIFHNNAPVLISAPDYNELVFLAAWCDEHSHSIAELLHAKLRKAKLCRADDLPSDVVCLGSWLTYRTDASARAFTHRLIIPAKHGSNGAELSLLTPLGIGVMGLWKGSRVPYQNKTAGTGWLTVSEVWHPIFKRDAVQRASAPDQSWSEQLRDHYRKLSPAHEPSALAPDPEPV